MTEKRDVVIVGGGPAGSAVAARLAQRGIGDGALILERYEFPREKPCGGALTGHIESAMADLDLVIDVPTVDSAEARVRFHDYERTVVMGKPVRMIRRREYDTSLLAQVAARGVEVRHGQRVKGYERRGDAIVVELRGGDCIEARVLVGADGVASVVRKGLATGAAKTPHRLFMAELPAPASRRADTRMLYDFTLMTEGLRGYSWVFPSPDDRVNVGLMHYPGHVTSSRSLLDLLGAELSTLDIELSGSRGWPVWGYHPGARISAPGIVLVGDAAGIDGLTGEGIAVALEQGAIAGDFIDRGLGSGDLGFGGYRRAIRRATVGRELALDRHLARMLYDWKADDAGWRRWLSLVLFDDDVLEMYARRVDGTEVLASQKTRLFRALGRHIWRRRERRQRLAEAQGVA